MNQLKNFYAVPVLAAAPVVQFGEGDFCYNGMRGLGQIPPFEALNPQSVMLYVGGAIAVGLVVWAAWRG